MAILLDQAFRLLRETWGSPSELAEEIYAMLSADTPLQVSGPIQQTNTTDAPAYTILQLGDQPAINIKRPGATPGTSTDTPIGGAGATTVNPVVATGGGVVPGVVVSGGPGPGPYVVSIYPNGLLGQHFHVSVTQLSIDAGETIPAGTWAMVSKVGMNYYFQVPVWGPP